MNRRIAACLALVSCSPVPPEFRCDADAQCTRQGLVGWCEAGGWCAFADQTCPETARRFAAASGEQANRCVPPVHPLVPPLVADAGYFTNQSITLSGTLNTDAPPSGDFDVWPQTTGGEVLVLHAARVQVPAGLVMRVRGSRPLAILARDELVIDGTLDAAAHLIEPGPGGFASNLGAGAGGAGRSNLQLHMNSGGGGAGHATLGATGGVGGAADELAGGTAGPITFDPRLLTLMGGSGGGEGGVDTCEPALGGAGGGAVLLFSTGRIVVSASGRVLAGGGGGQGGRTCVWRGAGGGGGAGGTIMLSAPSVSVQGVIAANGGAGGAGAGVATGATGGDGEDGRPARSPARGGTAPPGATAGGAGGSADGPPVTPPQSGLDDGGGGGGAVGVVRVTTTVPWSPEGTISPLPLVQ